MMIVIYPMAWSDFDGTDDMAMTVVNGATHGTLAYSRLLTITPACGSNTVSLTDRIHTIRLYGCIRYV
jgi:hypothetical protein